MLAMNIIITGALQSFARCTIPERSFPWAPPLLKNLQSPHGLSSMPDQIAMAWEEKMDSFYMFLKNLILLNFLLFECVLHCIFLSEGTFIIYRCMRYMCTL